MKHLPKAFTLIELLIVIVIIGILAVALIPRLTWSQWRARDVARKADLRQIENALALYSADNNGNYPVTSSPVCIGAPQWQRCRPWYIQTSDGSAGALAFGNDSFVATMKDYMTSFPTDPQPQRTIGNRYIYYKGNADINCNTTDKVHNKHRLFWMPEKSLAWLSRADSNEICSPWKVACCSQLWCSVNRFCANQLD